MPRSGERGRWGLPNGSGRAPRRRRGGHRAIDVKCFEERRLLARRQVTRTAERDAGQRQWAEPHPAKLLHRDPYRLHDATHHVEHPLVEDHGQEDAVARFPKEPKLVGNDLARVDEHAVANPPQGSGRGAIARQDMVFLGQPVARMHDAVGDLPVVGQEEEALRVSIKSPDGVDALATDDEVHHGSPTAFVARRRDVSGRFVEEHVAEGLRTQQLAVEPKLGRSGIDLRPECRDDLSVDHYATGDDKCLGSASGAGAASGEDTLESLVRVDGSLPPRGVGRYYMRRCLGRRPSISVSEARIADPGGDPQGWRRRSDWSTLGG